MTKSLAFIYYMGISNQIGRSLEFAIVSKIIASHDKNKIKLTPRLIANQKRDEIKFSSLTPLMQKECALYASGVYFWLEEEFKISQQTIALDRLSDLDAVKGDVTDIRIEFNNSSVNLSVKHNHSALKHQRPPRLAIQAGFVKKSSEDLEYRKMLGKITNNFIHLAYEKFPAATLFNQIKSKDLAFIDKQLYLPVCNLVAEFINKKIMPENAAKLFNFLVGNTDFYKVTASDNQLTIEEFAKLGKPTNVKAAVRGSSYVILNFSNGWIIEMRLHTASSRIGKNPSLKFDTQLANSKIPKKVVDCEKI